ncbi:hypothetical protein ppKF707_2264 [Metapseudomonas furukawaii]|uniref:Uncharacterized protein n=1 Tax=Metapseudomonas furukawaii TaxID=1149133 RepID=A0AAD1FDD4_METFU|nr:hypothetical protein ppKF707_2264 [Pseudomonas furukawaii]BAU71804.1 hypothetical protein KF707C_1160 [Pseudomonas furukawaii]
MHLCLLHTGATRGAGAGCRSSAHAGLARRESTERPGYPGTAGGV